MQRFLLALAMLATMGSEAALAASGTALGVRPEASAETAGASRVLNVGADIFIGDLVTTGRKGNVQIRFSDRTELVVGPNSSLVIEDYLLRDDGSTGKLAVNALSGTFRFVTGGAPKDRYLIKTPTGTVGVRGTAFDLNVVEDHTSLLLFEGAVRMCNLANQCIDVEDVCEVGRFDLRSAELQGTTDTFRGETRASMRGMFPFAADQSPLLGSFRLDQAFRCLNREVPKPAPKDWPEEEDSPPPKRDQRG
jgi:hypothetical protein